MAGEGRRGAGDRVLESRHLVGLFLGVVLLCGVFFTLGYVMGRTQFSGSVHAAETTVKAAGPVSAATRAKESGGGSGAPAPGEWDFYTKKDDDHLDPAANSPANSSPRTPASVPAVASRTPGAPPAAVPRNVSAIRPPARFSAPQIPKGAIILQLAALSRQGDALDLADAAQQKKFPAFVAAPGSDNLYRVQVGPYRDAKSAEDAQKALEQAGFKAIIKR
ncbi:MAG: SPOR domain-containing protein [Candidatus Acidiferrales bacterium]